MTEHRVGVNGVVQIDPNEVLGIERDEGVVTGASVLLWPGRWRIALRESSGGGGGGGAVSSVAGRTGAVVLSSVDLTDFTEATQDVVGGMVAAAGGTYDDAAGTITLPSGGGGGGSSTITADDTPAAPAEGESASYLVTSAVTWPAGLVWSTDPDGGVAPTITGTALVSLFTVGGVTRAIMGATFPAPPDTTLPTAGTLAASAITSSGFTLTVTGAADETALHATPYAFSTDNGVAYSAWQASSVYAASGLAAETTYTCIHKVRDAAGNVATGAATTTTTTAGGSGGPYAWARRVTPEPTNPVTRSATVTTHTYAVAGTAGRLLVAGFSADKDAGTITVSAGWNLVAHSIGSNVSGALAWRVATGSDDITWTIGTARTACCDVHEFTGYVSPTVDVFASFPDSGTNRSSLAVTAGNATADGMAVAIAGQDTVEDAVAPLQTVDSGYTMRSWNTSSGSSWTGNSLLMAAKNVSAGGSTAATFGFGSNSDQAFGIVAVFKG